jgi:hypothetical protein
MKNREQEWNNRFRGSHGRRYLEALRISRVGCAGRHIVEIEVSEFRWQSESTSLSFSVITVLQVYRTNHAYLLTEQWWLTLVQLLRDSVLSNFAHYTTILCAYGQAERHNAQSLSNQSDHALPT